MTPPPALARSVPGALRWAPAVTVAAFALPIAAGLLGTALPAFGVMPAIGAHTVGLGPWRDLFAQPGFGGALRLTLVTGLLTTAIAVLAAIGLAAVMQQRALGRHIGTLIAPVLAAPHSALAIGLAFLIAPSGWLVRLVSPALTGWQLPPDVSTVGHPSGWALIAGLLIKEVPYLMLMTLGALNQVNAQPYLAAARSLGYGPVQAYLKVLLPLVYPQIRLPVYAVLAFSLSVVDVSMILGPGNPPTLAVLAVREFSDPDLQRVLPASAAAMLLLVVVAASIAAWRALEWALAAWGRGWIARGHRRGPLAAAAAVAGGACGLLFAATVLASVALLMWSFAQQWRYPAALPTAWTLANWARQGSAALQPMLHTLAIGACATAVAALLVIACLENEAQRGTAAARESSARSGDDTKAARWSARSGDDTKAARWSARSGDHTKAARWSARSLWLLYMPLLVPQVAFLFGVQVLLVRVGLDATWSAVVWAHLVFVLPYFFLSLADPWRAFDARYARTAASLGASRWRVFWRIKLPILLKPTLIACAVAFAVSVGQYLPTLFAGSGRVATLTTEAVTLASGQDRRVTAVWAILQALLPFIVFAAAALLPRWLYAHRRALA